MPISFKDNLKVDIFHRTLPLPIYMKKALNVVTVHDIIPITLPHSTKVNLRHYSNMTHASLNKANLIFSVSEQTKRDLINNFNISEDKIHVTYQSSDIHDSYKKVDDHKLKEFLHLRFGLKMNNYFLYYGNIEPKKNIRRLCEAFIQARTELPLVIVGNDAWLFKDVTNYISSLQASQKKILRIPYLGYSDLMLLLKGAKGLLFPSLYEGFGLPVLEAMQLGVPVVTSNTSSLPEIGGDAVHYVDPLSLDSLISAIEKFSNDSGYLTTLTVRGISQSAKFTRERHLERISQGYSKLFCR
jgi:Glycosyltransferase